MTDQPFPTGALPTPPEKLAQGWPISLALAAPTVAPARFHHPGCGPTLNQSPYGACVGYSATAVHAAQEFADEGRQLIPGTLDPLRLYAEVKGLSWPPGPETEWDPSPGLWPAQGWAYAKANGFPTKDGSPRRRISAYYLLGTPDGSLAFLETYQQTLLQLGPVQLSTLWPHNWFSVLAGGYMQPPSFAFAPSGHAYEGCGWVTPCGIGFAGCLFDTIAHQSWGPWGKDPDYRDHFRIHSPPLAQVGKEAWKSIDIKGDAPAPPVPPERTMTLPIYDAAPKNQLVDLVIGTKLFSTADGKTPFIIPEVKSGGVGLWSPCATNALQRLVRVSAGGQVQFAIVALASCRNIRDVPTAGAYTKADLDAAAKKAATAVAMAAAVESAKYGG